MSSAQQEQEVASARLVLCCLGCSSVFRLGLVKLGTVETLCVPLLDFQSCLFSFRFLLQFLDTKFNGELFFFKNLGVGG